MSRVVPMRQVVSRAIGGGWGYDEASESTERVAVIRGADFPAMAVGDVSAVPVRWEERRKLQSRRLEPNDIVLEISGGTSDRPTGRTVFASGRLLESVGRPTIPASFCRLVRIDASQADPYYVYWWLQGMYTDGRTWAYQNRSTGIANFQFEHFLDAEHIRLPAIREQRAIAATLGALDDKIESNRRAISVMEELARSTFEQIFDLEQVGDGVALSELVDVNPRRVLRSGTPATYVGMSSIPEFSAEVYNWEIREAGSGQRFVSGDVLMARITPCLENGKTAVVDMLQPDEVGWGSTEYVVLSPAGLFSTPWIYCLVRNDRIRDFAIRSMTGTSGRQRFQADRFSQYRIVLPEATDLVRFNAVAEPLFTKMTQLRDESLKLTALRDALLPELLSGRIRVLAEGVAA